MLIDNVLLAFKNIRKRGIRSLLTMLGIFIGIAAVVSLISLGNGLQSALTGQFSQLGADKLTVMAVETGFGPPGSTAVRKLTDRDLEVIQRVRGVDLAVARFIRVVTVDYNRERTYEYVTSIPTDEEELELIYDSLNLEAAHGRLLMGDERKKVLLGNDFTSDRFGRPIRVGNTLIIQGEQFQVAGILKKAASFQINSAIFMPEDDLKQILDIGDEMDLILVQVENTDLAEQTAQEIMKAMRRDRNLEEGEEDFSVQTPQQSLQTINTILIAINAVVAGIAAISLLVGGIGITNTMYTAVLERTKEIGVMKAVGARNQDVMLIFLAESAFLGLAGGIVGAAIGLGLAYAVSAAVTTAFSGLNFGVSFSLPLILGAVSFSLLVGAISGVVPALQASRMKPVEALRA